ncbi:ImmA/IrrE family metallo-endopeptidase [Microbacterium paludicola]|uniref:ImmA/IrrE family metallo-endopeptidase n=1 Tax=Microbacterium paludicola TaxID=300019 RepID=UPI0011A7A2CD|nr:ImmA/IrrE family metallo-endopeptidase [Microbacterium paludicola]
MLELVRFAASLGIELHASHLPEDVLGYYSPDESRIYFDLQLTPNERRTTIAHELGHAHYGHRCDTSRNELQADKYAATLLINPAEYADLETINPDRHFLADELAVTVELLEFYERHCLTRLRGVTYTRARHGIHQWAHRVEYA